MGIWFDCRFWAWQSFPSTTPDFWRPINPCIGLMCLRFSKEGRLGLLVGVVYFKHSATIPVAVLGYRMLLETELHDTFSQNTVSCESYKKEPLR